MDHSAGLLLYRRDPEIEVFLGHFGGPYWQNKEQGAWTIPKGVVEDGEAPLDAAQREFKEETGLPIPTDPKGYVELGTIEQSSHKRVTAWAVEGDVDPDALESDAFEMEWPPNSGTAQTFPELDRAAYFDLETAAEKIVDGQRAFLDRLRAIVSRQS